MEIENMYLRWPAILKHLPTLSHEHDCECGHLDASVYARSDISSMNSTLIVPLEARHSSFRHPIGGAAAELPECGMFQVLIGDARPSSVFLSTYLP